ncbi:HAMP domain-containing histidine kinase [Catenulispora sp. NF23]|uniref:sensor histidine kinase n=1 Tax=Catenulispora pinistramenti TaxID=2705254 RepID=UPI001BAACA29|nr:HAMP domain-containing sensor histidine kinase [Catenulispora pinistramenti]MBS2532776.1 HAMP domain-containing histidine kinase [Catenulispora pinistramenti]
MRSGRVPGSASGTRVPRRRTLSIHARLFAGFGGTLGVSAALMVAIIYLGIRYVPSYDLKPGLPVTDVQRSTTIVLPQNTIVLPHAAAISTKQDVWSAVLITSIAALLVVTTVGLGAGWVLSRRLLAPIHAIGEAASRAADGHLHDRINASGPPDELKRLADTFDAMLARLEESFAAHQRFAATASHELLTPLATTRAILQVAETDVSGEELAELAPMLRATNERSIVVVTALLQLAATDRMVPDPEPVDLSALVAETVAERRDTAAARRISVGVDVAPQCPVPGNAALLRQLITNLLNNALAYNVEGGRVSVTVDLRRGDAVLMVTNTGPQIPPDSVERLFEPFQRARPRVASDRSGHGLGLAIVRSVAKAHGGGATATARPDGGLAVRVTVPVPYRG